MDMNKSKKESLYKLQREYLQRSLDHLDQMIVLSHDLTGMEDPDMIVAYSAELDRLNVLVDDNYRIANQIEETLTNEHLCSES